MRWTPGERNPDVEDMRGSSGGGGGGFGVGRMGIGGFVVLLLLSLIFHRNFFALLGGGGSAGAPAGSPAAQTAPVSSSPEESKQADFVGAVLKDVQNTWTQILPAQANVPYRHAKLDLFRGGIRSGCGFAQSEMGPFYCPADEKVYIDLGFYRELQSRFGASGDFAQAYVIAHEVGHHVQKLFGIADKVQELKDSSDQATANALQVRMELQADCFAGVWANLNDQLKKRLQPGDVEAGLNAASQIGDDMIQKRTQGRVVPESFTHGTSAQRVKWFKAGLESGDINSCDTFSSSP
jgi:predicted metalloprotease